MNKGIWAGLVAIAFVAGSITTGTMAYAAAGGQGDNLIIDAINNLAAVIQGKELEADVTAEVTIPDGAIIVNAPAGPQGEQGPPGPPGPPGPGGTDTLASLSCSSGQVAKFISGAWVCGQDNDQVGITTEIDPKVGTLINGRWCQTNGAQVNCDVIPVPRGYTTGNLYLKIDTVTVAPGTLGTAVSPPCDTGDILVNGGFIQRLGGADFRIGISAPQILGSEASPIFTNSWIARGYNTAASDRDLTAYGFCADITP